MKAKDQAQFSERVIQDLKKRSMPGMLFYLMLAAIIIFSDDFYSRHTDFCIWFGLSITGISSIRITHIVISKWVKAHSQFWDNAILFVSVGITGLIWGCFFAVFMTLEDEHITKILISICTAGLVSGGVVAFIPCLRLALFFNFSMLAPCIVFMSICQVNGPLALAFLLFSVYIVFMAKNGNDEYWQALENEHLLIEKTRQLNFLSQVDGLTGLYNRRHFDERLDQAWKKASRLQQPNIIILCDIDHFKRVNDQHGHQAGDEFLKITANLIKSVFKRDTDIVARFGGEEFIVLLTDCTSQVAFDLSEDLRQRMEGIQMPYKEITISATLSIGIACLTPGSGESSDTLIARADEALYRAKGEGRNKTVVASEFKTPR